MKRYVDDVVAIVKIAKLNDVINAINNICSDIPFTHELEVDGRLPFLDLLIIRNNDGSLMFDI